MIPLDAIGDPCHRRPTSLQKPKLLPSSFVFPCSLRSSSHVFFSMLFCVLVLVSLALYPNRQCGFNVLRLEDRFGGVVGKGTTCASAFRLHTEVQSMAMVAL
jgi:hypothetical protein